MSDTLIGLPIFISAFVLAFIIGAIGNKTHFCTLGGVSDWINMNNKGRLGAWLLAIVVAALGVSLMEWLSVISLNDTRPPYRSANFSWPRYVLGGLMFGIGMTLASGCTAKILIRIGGGNFKSLLVFLVVGLCAYLMTKTNFYGIVFHSWIQPTSVDLAPYGLSGQDFGSIASGLFGTDPSTIRLAVSTVLAVLVVVFIGRSVGWRNNGHNILSGSAIGLCVFGAWYLTAGPWGQEWIEAVEWLDERPLGVGAQSFTFVNPIGETLSYAAAPTNTLLLTFGVVAVFGVIIGSFAYALISRKWHFEWFQSWDDLLRHVIGGALMGIGGVLALGCTVGQGITGVSTLALGSFLALGAIILGSAATMKIQLYLMVYEDASWLDALITGCVDLHLLPSSLRRLEAV